MLFRSGGLWVDYNLMTTIPGLHAIGEANFSDHGANRLGASALMQGLADGYFILPYTIGHYIASTKLDAVTTSAPEFGDAENSVRTQIANMMAVGKKGTRSPDSFYKEVGHLMWDNVGMARNEQGLKQTVAKFQAMRDEFAQNVRIPGDAADFNKTLEKAGRVADFIELGELMCIDALNRRESCGGHFRAESQTDDGEALRHDDEYAYVAAWEWAGPDAAPVLHKEDLVYTAIEMKQRSYK